MNYVHIMSSIKLALVDHGAHYTFGVLMSHRDTEMQGMAFDPRFETQESFGSSRLKPPSHWRF